MILVCYTAVFTVVTQRSSRHNTKHGCGCIEDETDIGYSVNIALVSHIGERRCVTRQNGYIARSTQHLVSYNNLIPLNSSAFSV